MNRRVLAALFGLLTLLMLPSAALAAEEFDPAEEFELKPYVDLDFGVIDMSINKAVIYMWVSAAIIIGLGLFVVRKGIALKPEGSQNVLEMAYEFTESQIGRATLPDKIFSRYFPFIATLFLFIAVNNLISFIPLPFAPHTGTFPGGIPDVGLYAATANISVTLALTVVVFLLTHYEGVKAHGPLGYVKTLIPDAPAAIKPVIFVLEVLSQLLRLVSLSVRLFANLLAGHLLIIMAAGFPILLGSIVVGFIALPVGVAFWLFEWVLVAGLQAYIFAMLSGIYIGYAVEPPH